MTNPNRIGTVYKTPTEHFTVGVDFSSYLDTLDTVVSGTVTCFYGTTTNTATMISDVTDDNDDHVTFTLYGGTAGCVYEITVTATTLSGDVFVALLTCVVN
jgi:hypothetical protein